VFGPTSPPASWHMDGVIKMQPPFVGLLGGVCLRMKLSSLGPEASRASIQGAP